MLKALYDYAIRHSLTLPEGYVKKTIKAYISLSSADPTYVGIRMGEEETVPCPDIGSMANSKDKSNVLVEKRSVVVPTAPSVKNTFFCEALLSCSQTVPAVTICVDALQDPVRTAKMQALLDQNKVKDTERISFQVDNCPILEMDGVLNWWVTFRKQFTKQNDAAQVPCMITGELTTPMATVPSINGLYAVGGHSSGDALICFDKSAFCSYGLKQAANAPVSEEAFAAVKAALDTLLEDAPMLVISKNTKDAPKEKRGKAPKVTGMKFVHWYDVDISPQDDPIFDDDFLGTAMMDSTDEDEPEPEEPVVTEQDERSARTDADTLVKSIQTGENPTILNTQYHILLLTGVGGRVMVRRYLRGRYEELQRNLQMWSDDLQLLNAYGTGSLRAQKLVIRLGRLLKFQNANETGKKFYERLDKELSGVTPTILTAILEGRELPDAVAVRALAYIRSKIYANADDDSKTDTNLDSCACQWLKAWLVRRERKKEVMLMEGYNREHTEPAYHCGAMMAIYAWIQNIAYKEVNVGVTQRFYASAVQSPAMVLGRLSKMSVHHIEKITNEKLAEHFLELLAQCSLAIGDRIPTTMSLEQQSYFALGYYQMQAQLLLEKRTANAKKEAAKENDTEEDQ